MILKYICTITYKSQRKKWIDFTTSKLKIQKTISKIKRELVDLQKLFAT